MSISTLIDVSRKIADKGVSTDDGYTYSVPASSLVTYRDTIRALANVLERVRVACAAHDSWNACVCDACVAIGANPAAIEYEATK